MTSLFNIKPREVYCPNCKRIRVTDEPCPVCEECFGKPMLTVLRSLITGERLHELGSGDSKSSQ